jgi:hypothetical protein
MACAGRADRVAAGLAAILLLSLTAPAKAVPPEGPAPTASRLVQFDTRQAMRFRSADGQSDGYAYNFSSAETLVQGRPGGYPGPARLSYQEFGLGREFHSDAGAFSLGGAAGYTRVEYPTAENLSDYHNARLELGPQLGYRSDPHSRIAAELHGSYFWTRSRWAGRTFVGWRTGAGWAVGPEAWRQGEGFSRSAGAGVAVHDLRLAPLRIGLRFGVDTRSALGRRYLAGNDLSWDQP